MNWADWIILAVIAVSALISVKRGFVKEALSLFIWITAFVVARTFNFNMAELLVDYIDTYSVRLAAAFAILFAATLIVGALASHLISALVQATGLTGTDRLLGMVFGMVRGGLIIVVFLALVKNTPVTNDLWWRESYLVPQFLVLEEWSFNLFKQWANYLLNFSR